MAKVRIIMAMTLDGFLPEENEKLVQWVKTDKKGFAYWEARSTVTLFPHYPLMDLMDDKDKEENPCTYLAEISEMEDVELLRGLSGYQLVDEMVIYRLPLTNNGGMNLSDVFPKGEWTVTEVRTYRNGICRTIYRKIKN